MTKVSTHAYHRRAHQGIIDIYGITGQKVTNCNPVSCSLFYVAFAAGESAAFGVDIVTYFVYFLNQGPGGSLTATMSIGLRTTTTVSWPSSQSA